jgi:hypothetical protein
VIRRTEASPAAAKTSRTTLDAVDGRSTADAHLSEKPALGGGDERKGDRDDRLPQKPAFCESLHPVIYAVDDLCTHEACPSQQGS